MDEEKIVPAEEVAEAPVADPKEVIGQVLQYCQALLSSGDRPVIIYIRPDYLEQVKQAAQEDEIFPDEWLPLFTERPDAPVPEGMEVPIAQITSAREVEEQYLEMFYGPTEMGGNGLIQKIVKYQHDHKIPISLNHDVLRVFYFLDLRKKLEPQILAASASSPLRL